MKRIKATVEVLSQSEIEMIHRGSLRILENIGLKMPNEECLNICESLGAKVDRSTETVKIPAPLMESVLGKIKGSDRYRKPGDDIEKLYGYISTQVSIVDYKSRTRRYGNLEDIKKGLVLVDRLDNFKETNIIVVPAEIPKAMVDITAFQMCYSYSKKPGRSWILLPESAKYIIGMANLTGQRVSYSPETVSPLQFRKESLEIALVFAKEAKYLYMGPMVMSGASGPVTLAGTVTMQNAEALGSIFLIYALNNEFSFYNTGTHSMDLKTMLCSFGSPNQALLGICIAQMGKFYGLKSVSNSGLTDALMPDFQGGFEKASNAVFSCLAGSSGIGCQGIVGADQGISLEQLVLDNEWLDAYNYILGGIEVNDETIALDIIEEIGIGGNFLSEEHTVRHMRDNYWRSGIFNRDCWDTYYNNKTPDLLERAHAYVESVTGGKTVDPVISGSVFDELDYIVKCAEKELVK